jgi:hypothetical protein
MAHDEKLLFLDLDGVLHPAVGTFHQFRESCCRQLARVVAATRCRVVLSSSWRCYESSLQQATTALRRHGIELADVTPEYDGRGARAREILSVVDGSGAARWVALDDEDLVGGGEEEEGGALSHFSSAATSARMAPHTVRTDADTGMTCAIADRCIAILGREVAEEAVAGAGTAGAAAAGVDHHDHDHDHDHEHDRSAAMLDLV